MSSIAPVKQYTLKLYLLNIEYIRIIVYEPTYARYNNTSDVCTLFLPINIIIMSDVIMCALWFVFKICFKI